MAGTPIWTRRTAPGVSDYFDVTDPPMTISVDRLRDGEVVHVRSSSQDDTGPPLPFRDGGSVKLDYNHTKINIWARGRFCLEIEKTPEDPLGIDATRSS